MYSYLMVMVMALTTMAIRFLPFVLFRRKTPDFIMYLGKMLPMCAMAMLVVFCYRNVSLGDKEFLPGLISALVVIIAYRLKHNTALAIISGTAVYMILVQKVF